MGLEEARAAKLEALVGGLRGAAYRAASDSQAGASRALGAESRSTALQNQARPVPLSVPHRVTQAHLHLPSLFHTLACTSTAHLASRRRMMQGPILLRPSPCCSGWPHRLEL